MAEKTKKSSRWAAIKTEFSKIIWPDAPSVARQTTAVVLVTLVTGFIILILDYVIQYGVEILMNL